MPLGLRIKPVVEFYMFLGGLIFFVVYACENANKARRRVLRFWKAGSIILAMRLPAMTEAMVAAKPPVTECPPCRKKMSAKIATSTMKAKKRFCCIFLAIEQSP